MITEILGAFVGKCFFLIHAAVSDVMSLINYHQIEMGVWIKLRKAECSELFFLLPVVCSCIKD